jgi:hypothetical protein
MSAFMFRAKIKNEHADEAEAAVKHMFAAVKKAHPDGVGYAPRGYPTG